MGVLIGLVAGSLSPPLSSLLNAPLPSPPGLPEGKEVPSVEAPSPAASSPALVGTLKCLAILPIPIIFRRASRMVCLLLESVASAGITTAISPCVSPVLPPGGMPTKAGGGGCEGAL